MKGGLIMSALKHYKHLTYDDRLTIQEELGKGTSKRQIAIMLSKDPSTICKEVKTHRFLHRNLATSNPNGVPDCIHKIECDKKFCSHACERYEMSPCKRRDKIGVCNKCSNINSSQCTHYKYEAKRAHKEYEENRSDSRQGVDLTSSQAKELGSILKPLVDQGQSLYVIKRNHPEIKQTTRTLYNYVTDGVFTQDGLYDIDLRLKVTRKQPKKGIKSKPRESRAYIVGRTYSSFIEYSKLHPGFSVVEMDTVYNDISKGPFIQTFMINDYGIMIGVLHSKINAQSMVNGLTLIKERLGEEAFKRIFRIILTDRGSEFTSVKEMESLGTKLFYCDPQRPDQKPHVENNHTLLRWILPNKKDLNSIGLNTQEDLDLVFSHINSYPRSELGDKTPIEVFEFFNQDNLDLLDKLQIKKIDKDSVILKPYLLMNK